MTLKVYHESPDEPDFPIDQELADAVAYNDIELVKERLKAGANPNATGWKKEPLVFVAMLNQNDDIASILVEAGVNLEVRRLSGLTPLMLCCMHGLENTTRALIARGVGVNEIDDDGNSPLDIAVEHGHAAIAEQLVSAGGRRNSERESE